MAKISFGPKKSKCFFNIFACFFLENPNLSPVTAEFFNQQQKFSHFRIAGHLIKIEGKVVMMNIMMEPLFNPI